MSNQNAGDERLRLPYAQGDHQLGPYPSLGACLTACFCRCPCFCIFFFFLTLFFVYSMFLMPRRPEFNLQHVDVESLLIVPNAIGGAGGTASPSAASPSAASPSAAPPSAAYLSLNITLRFASVNPNNVNISHEASNLPVLYHGVPLGTAAVQGFEQPAFSTQLVDSRVSVSRFNMLQVDSPELVRDASVSDNLELRVTAGVVWKIRTLGHTHDTLQVPVDCLVVLSPRNQSLAYKICNDGRAF